ncbi:MAG: PAS domain S-box protein, partial [Thermodesulfovibrionales bacterium]|nr:PAS domain S-box protein [Thermodesulfovibrionales bacterium]
MNDIKNHPDYQNLSLKYKLAIRYIRNKTNQLLDVLGTMPLLADDITDDDLIKIDPIGIVSDTFATVLENLKDTNKNLEGALTEIEAILNATPAGIMIIDAQNRTIVNTNPSAEEIIGLSKNEIIGKKCCLFFCIDNKNECPVLDHNQTLNRCERNIIDSHGEMKTIIKSVKPITIKDKMFLVESFLDITENKRMFQELIKSQRIESLSLLAGGIAHDFNNALMAILGNISLAKNMIPEGDKAYDRLAKAEKAVEKAQLLSKQLLTFSKGGAPVLKKASIGDILIDTVNFASSGKNMKVIFDLKHELPILQIDEVQISQVFQNLTINASEAMTNGGILYVSACTVDNVYFNKNPKIKNFVKISFKDTGSGIKPELIDRIFDPFFTTK